MSDDQLDSFTQPLRGSPLYFKQWLIRVISFDENVANFAMRVCPNWDSFVRLRDIKPFIKALSEGKIPTLVSLPKRKKGDREKGDRDESKSKRKRDRKAAAAASMSVDSDAEVKETSETTVVNAPIVLPALAVENLKAAHKFVRLVAIPTGRKDLRGCDLSQKMLDVFKDEEPRLEKMLATSEQLPRLVKGTDTVTWLGRAKRWV